MAHQPIQQTETLVCDEDHSVRGQALRLLSYILAPLNLLLGFIYTIANSIVVIVAGWITSSRAPVDLIIHHVWSKGLLWLFRVDVEVEQSGELPESGFLYLFNHASYIDIPVMFGYLPRPFRFGAKIELFSIPFFGGAMRRAGILPIARNNRRAALRVYEEAHSRVQSGECFALAPEGTRQSRMQLGRFKRGPFLFAIGAQMPVVPVVLMGTREIMPKGQWVVNMGAWRRRVIMKVLPPVSTEGMTEDDLPTLQAQVAEVMAAEYAPLKKRLGLSD